MKGSQVARAQNAIGSWRRHNGDGAGLQPLLPLRIIIMHKPLSFIIDGQTICHSIDSIVCGCVCVRVGFGAKYLGALRVRSGFWVNYVQICVPIRGLWF